MTNNDYIILRDPVKNPNEINKILLTEQYIELFYKQKKILQLEEKIKNTTEFLSNEIFKIIPLIKEDKLRKNIINERRKFYTDIHYILNPYILKTYLDPEYYKLLEELIYLRESVLSDKKIADKILNDLENKYKEHISNLTLNETWFSEFLKISSPTIYNSTFDKKCLPKKKVKILLRYLYKSYTHCTPSSPWSGITLAQCVNNANNYHKDFLIYKERNRFKEKHFRRKYIIDNFSYLCKNINYYFNPSIYILTNKIFFTQVYEKK